VKQVEEIDYESITETESEIPPVKKLSLRIFQAASGWE
jgi:hypothetical protein